MKPERSELKEREEHEVNVPFTQVLREVAGDLLQLAFIKALGYVTRLWAPEVASQPQGADESDDDQGY